MPTKIRITKEDLLKSTLLNPAWYSAKVKQTLIRQLPPDNINYWITEMLITGGPTQKNGMSPVGVQVARAFFENATGQAAPFFRAFGVSDVTTDELDFDAANGRELKIFVNNGLNKKGKMSNIVEDFQPAA